MDLSELAQIQQTGGPDLAFQPTGDLMFDLMTGRISIPTVGQDM